MVQELICKYKGKTGIILSHGSKSISMSINNFIKSKQKYVEISKQ